MHLYDSNINFNLKQIFRLFEVNFTLMNSYFICFFQFPPRLITKVVVNKNI